MVVNPPSFEYDPAKSTANKRKHGIDFEEAKALWSNEALIPATGLDERRWVIVGRIGRKHGSCIMTVEERTSG